VRRWWPEREIVAVADSRLRASLKLLSQSCRRFLPQTGDVHHSSASGRSCSHKSTPRRAGQLDEPPEGRGCQTTRWWLRSSYPPGYPPPWRTGAAAEAHRGDSTGGFTPGTAQGCPARAQPPWIWCEIIREEFATQGLLCDLDAKPWADHTDWFYLEVADGNDLPGSAAASSDGAKAMVGAAIQRTSGALRAYFSQASSPTSQMKLGGTSAEWHGTVP